MLFNSFEFAIFLPIVFALFWLVPDKYRNLVILAASYYFYISWNVKYVVLILACTLISFLSGRLMDGGVNARHRKAVLGFSVMLCLLILGYFKYYNLLAETLMYILKHAGAGEIDLMRDILLPVGISFYTFQSVGYIADVYKGRVKAEKNLLDYAAFVSYFPQLVAGPIERTENLLPQIKAAKHFDYDSASYGMKLMVWGFYKKLVIADVMAPYVNTVYNNVRAHAGFDLILAIVFHTIQIYCDFSGYSDIARGCSRLFGIGLMKNFDSPFYSKSVSEFWRRWHISLTSWFRDYVYIPLGGNRKGALRKDLNLLVVFFLSGLWHGSSWHFVLWGTVHGIAQIIEAYLKKPLDVLRKTKPGSLFCMLYADLVFTVALVFFRAPSVSDALYAFRHFFDGIGSKSFWLNRMQLWPAQAAVIFVSVVLLFVFDAVNMKKDVIELIGKKKPVVRYGIYIMMLLVIMLFKASGNAEFVYFQF
ncbi:MAG: MBOAT family protein [Lachnospiraceae bacterium]|nr:MBOAT family protein [Lachnospiraceae bacterium]